MQGKNEGEAYTACFSLQPVCGCTEKILPSSRVLTEEELHIQTPEDFYNLVRKLTVRDESGNVVTYGLELDQDGEQFFYSLAAMYQEEPVKFWDEDMKAAF